MRRLNILRARNDKTYRYKLTVFLICLFISSFIWMLIKLSQHYSSEILIPVTYSKIPEGKIMVSKADTTIRIGITAQGFSLAWIKYFSRKAPINVNLSNFRLRQQMHQYVSLVNTEVWAKQFSEQYDPGGKIDYILPDTIAFYFEDRYFKEVPVETDIAIKFRKQYFAYDTLSITPKRVTISGLNKNISQVEFVNFTNLHENLNKNIALKNPVLTADIMLDPDEVNVKLQVEKFTESKIEVPIIKINEPDNRRVKIFPDKATITYLVALKDYTKMSADMFSCRVNLSEIDKRPDNKLDISLSSHPQFIKIVNIEPAEVDYLFLQR